MDRDDRTHEVKRWTCAIGHVIYAPSKPSACNVRFCKAPIVGELLRG
jgi:hypothetical protein